MSSWRRRTNSSSGGSSCGACKTLRRKCTQDCVFAPYFPPDNPQKFITVHRAYGASNVAKLLSELHPSQRAAAVESLVYEADLRLKDQVYGCVRPVAILQQNLRQVQETLERARRELAKYTGPSAMLPQIQQPQQQPNVYQMMLHHVQQMMIPMQAPHQGQLMIQEPAQQQQQSYEDFLQQQRQLQQEQQQWPLQQQLQQFLQAQQLGAVATSREAEMLRAYEQQLQQVRQQNQQQQQEQRPDGDVIRFFGDDRDSLTSTGYQMLEPRQLAGVAATREQGMLIRAYDHQQQQAEEDFLRSFNDTPPATGFDIQMLQAQQSVAAAAAKEQEMLRAYEQQQQQQQQWRQQQDDLLKFFDNAGGSVVATNGLGVQMLKEQQQAAVAREQETLRVYEQQPSLAMTGSHETHLYHCIPQEHPHSHLFLQQQPSVTTHLQQTEADKRDKSEDGLKGQQPAAVAREQETLRVYEQQPSLAMTGSHETHPYHHIPQEHPHSHLFLQQQQSITTHLQQTEADNRDKSEDGSRRSIGPSCSREIKSSSDHAF